MSGIIDFDVCLPSGIARVADMHAASGVPTADIMAITHCAEFPVLADGEQAWELAARQAVRSWHAVASLPNPSGR